VTDLTFSGFGGDPVRAWITRPPGDDPLPAVIEFVGYNGGRGLPGERLQWASAGFVHVLMDTRGQGGGWGSGGATSDPHGTGSSYGGFLTRGIENPQTYYYRRLFTDAALLVDVVAGLPFVDSSRIAVTGVSQGGGIALAAGAINPAVAAVMTDVPFLCHFRRSVELTPEAPFTEVARYLGVHRDREEQVFATLSYFDGVNFARRATAPAIFSVALMDDVVLPSSVFAAFNHYAHEDRQVEVYPFNDHDGGQLHQWYRQHAWLTERA
jgi:cephalosporin-C deacetylase